MIECHPESEWDLFSPVALHKGNTDPQTTPETIMTLAFWILVGLATTTCLFMAWSLGANSNSPPFAPAIGANAISTLQAAFLIGILAAAGALTQGGSISETVGADLILGITITPLAATTGLLVAASFMVFGVYTGHPVPAAFATTGAMVGVGLSLGSTIEASGWSDLSIRSLVEPSDQSQERQ